ncbi:MAG: phosphate signaling complex protein PhoU [Verrucomicrobiota bacterium]
MSTNLIKRYFHEELEDVRSKLLLMGEKAVEMVELSVKSLVEADLEYADSVIQKDRDVDDLETAIDHEAVRYISLRAPVASDLRLLTVAVKASHDLERVGDEATSMAKRSRRILAKGRTSELLDIPLMSRLTVEMLNSALDSFVEEDVPKAQSICDRDREIDQINRNNFSGFTSIMKDGNGDIETVMELIFISKSLERIADHATNIAEEVIYLLKGVSVRYSDQSARPRRNLV